MVQGVTLASLHAAKGLEWDAVFLVGLADGTLPISHALAHGPESEAVEEERRLLYVGITRARMHLALSWALARTPGGRQSRKPSRFLNGIAPQTATRRHAPAGQSADRGAASRCRVCNDHLRRRRRSCCAAARPARPISTTNCCSSSRIGGCVLAKELKVPAYVVFSDNTLIAIAETPPADDAALVAIPGIGARKLEQFGADVLGAESAAADNRRKTAGQKFACRRYAVDLASTRTFIVRRTRQEKEGRDDFTNSVERTAHGNAGPAPQRMPSHAADAAALAGRAQAPCRRRDRRVRGSGFRPRYPRTIAKWPRTRSQPDPWPQFLGTKQPITWSGSQAKQPTRPGSR